MALRVERWGRALATRTGTTVVFVDEYASSHEAEARLRKTSSGRRRSIDEIAATLILQDYLDGEAVA
jgi:RNase H-fold protein (predicted Holliday junction resolvase)